MTVDRALASGWVYSMADYCQMFDLQPAELASSLLNFPGDISSFNAEMHQQGYQVCSGDHYYGKSLTEVTTLAQQVLAANQHYLQSHRDLLRDQQVISAVVEQWQQSVMLFLEDYDNGKAESRYQFMALPQLPFTDHQFDIALCAQHLFNQPSITRQRQQQAIEELCRVAKEVRIFPLMDEHGKVAETLGDVMLNFQQQNYGIEVRQVDYHQIKGSNAMLRIWAAECVVS